MGPEPGTGAQRLRSPAAGGLAGGQAEPRSHSDRPAPPAMMPTPTPTLLHHRSPPGMGSGAAEPPGSSPLRRKLSGGSWRAGSGADPAPAAGGWDAPCAGESLAVGGAGRTLPLPPGTPVPEQVKVNPSSLRFMRYRHKALALPGHAFLPSWLVLFPRCRTIGRLRVILISAQAGCCQLLVLSSLALGHHPLGAVCPRMDPHVERGEGGWMDGMEGW